MVKTFASFLWDIHIPKDEQQPYAEVDIRQFVDALRSPDVNVSPPVDGEYAWDFTANLPHIRMDCKLALVEDQKWLLCCHPSRGFMDWLRGAWREEEQQSFIKITDSALRSDPRITDIQWHSQEEWDRSGS